MSDYEPRASPLQAARNKVITFVDPENFPSQLDMGDVIVACREALNSAPEWVTAALDQLAIDIGLVNRGQWAVVKSGPMTRVVLAAALEQAAKNAESLLISEAMATYMATRITVNTRADEVPPMLEVVRAHRRRKQE